MISSAKVIRTLERQVHELESAGSEVCPLCLSRYAAVVECICAACEAPSCPECAAPIAGTPKVLCSACHVPTTH
ncbi:MAG TPA: hypothetical protein VFX59_24660 [Polyangiales bacterium]|nr:hypothetical protein [Polyangiales bacterium]